MRSKLIYWLVYSGMWLFSALPFRVLYMLSDLNYLLMYRVGKYRRKVVRGNLLRSFPEKNRCGEITDRTQVLSLFVGLYA